MKSVKFIFANEKSDLIFIHHNLYFYIPHKLHNEANPFVINTAQRGICVTFKALTITKLMAIFFIIYL